MRFVLVHGGLHGAWCWTYLIPELEALGHEAIAMDLPGHGDRTAERATLDAYRTAVVELLEPGDVLVGHSMGGPVITMAADTYPGVSHCVYLAAGVPVEGESIVHELRTSDEVDESESGVMTGATNPLDQYVDVDDERRLIKIASLESAKAYFYHDCRDEIVRWAFERLTPQSVSVLVDEKVSVPRFWDAEIPRSFIICTDDRAEPFAGYMERQAERLGVKALPIRASHSPFLSRPGELATLLVQATSTVPTDPPRPTL